MRRPVLRDLQGEGWWRGAVSRLGGTSLSASQGWLPTPPRKGLGNLTAWSACPALPIPGSYCHPLNRCAK